MSMKRAFSPFTKLMVEEIIYEGVKHTFAYCSFPYVAVAANDTCARNYRLIGEHFIDCYIVY